MQRNLSLGVRGNHSVVGQLDQEMTFKKVRHSGATCEPRVHEAGTGRLL